MQDDNERTHHFSQDVIKLNPQLDTVLGEEGSLPLPEPNTRLKTHYRASQSQKLITEKDLCVWLEDLLTVLGYIWCHFRPARTKDSWRTAITGHKGWFDYVAIRRTRFVVLEVKSEKGKLSPEQKDWHNAVDLLNILRMRKGYNNPVEKYILFPSNRDFIEECLK